MLMMIMQMVMMVGKEMIMLQVQVSEPLREKRFQDMMANICPYRQVAVHPRVSFCLQIVRLSILCWSRHVQNHDRIDDRIWVSLYECMCLISNTTSSQPDHNCRMVSPTSTAARWLIFLEKKYASDSSLPPALRISRLGDLRLAKRRLAQYKDIGNDAQEAAVDLSFSTSCLANRNISLF